MGTFGKAKAWALRHVDRYWSHDELRQWRRKLSAKPAAPADPALAAPAAPADPVPAPIPSSTAAPDVSVVIPSYNKMPAFRQCLESLVTQQLGGVTMEAIVVDDGSTDGTWELAQEYAAAHPGTFRALRMEVPSGSPSAPRTRGLREARGRYVFFLDADDWLGPQAIQRMVRHADEWGSDVLLVRFVGENGRSVPESMFAAGNQPKVDPLRSASARTLGILKLFRRSLVADLTFPNFMPEDMAVCLRAYCRAETVSVAADYDYYHYSWDGAESNVSATSWDDTASAIEAIADAFAVVEREDPSALASPYLMNRLFERDVARTARALRNLPADQREQRLAKLASVAAPYYSQAISRALPLADSLALDAVLGVPGKASADLALATRLLGASDGALSLCSYSSAAGGRLLCTSPAEEVREVSESVKLSFMPDTQAALGTVAGTLQAEGLSPQALSQAIVAVELRGPTRLTRRTLPCTVTGVEPTDDRLGAQASVSCDLGSQEGHPRAYLTVRIGSFLKSVKLEA